jgi:hypothetical protein
MAACRGGSCWFVLLPSNHVLTTIPLNQESGLVRFVFLRLDSRDSMPETHLATETETPGQIPEAYLSRYLSSSSRTNKRASRLIINHPREQSMNPGTIFCKFGEDGKTCCATL